MISSRLNLAGGLLLAAMLAACSGTEGLQGPGPMLADNVCAQLRGDLNAMDRRGVPSMIDARNNGRKYGPQQDAEINRYNQVLDQYLGGQCASEQRYKAKAGIVEGTSKGTSRRASVDGASGTTATGQQRVQVKRRKPVSEDGDQAAVSNEASDKVEKAAAADSVQDKPVRRKAAGTNSNPNAGQSASSQTTASIPSPTPAKSESGLPAAPAPVKAEPAAAKADTSDKTSD